MLKFLFPFFISFISTVLLFMIAIPIAKKWKWHGRASGRHIHTKKIPRIGGLVMISVFNAAILLNSDLFKTPELYGVLISTIAILAFGFWDDIKEIYWKFQLFFQVALSVFVFIVGVRIYYITNFLTGGILMMDVGLMVVFSISLVMIWIVLLINAINWLDGIDGLSGGVGFIAAATILALSLHRDVNQPPVAIICSVFLGTILGFLIFNFYPSKVLAGTSGAMFMGFILAVLAIFAGTKIATAMLVAIIPIIDSVSVIVERIRKKKSIFKPDKLHLHYKLLEIGWSQRKIAISYYLMTVIIAIVALNTRFIGKSITLIAAILIMLAVYIYVNNKIVRKNNQSL